MQIGQPSTNASRQAALAISALIAIVIALPAAWAILAVLLHAPEIPWRGLAEASVSLTLRTLFYNCIATGLAFILFDPRSDDGFMTWNLLDETLARTPAPDFYPVVRTMEEMKK